MKITVKDSGDCLTVHLEGEVTGPETKALFNAIRENKKPGHERIVVDLSQVSYIDSIGLGTLIDLHQTLSQTGVKFNLSGTRDEVKRLFWDCNLHMMFDIEPPPPEDEA